MANNESHKTSAEIINADLFSAIYNGITETVKRLINDGADINQTNKYGNTPIISCINKMKYQKKNNDLYDTELFDFLVEKGANLSVSNNNGGTAFSAAIQQKNDDIAMRLVELGASIEYVNYDGVSLLSLAAVNDCIQVARHLIKSGHDVKSLDDGGEECLFYALCSTEGSRAMIELMLNNGADVNAISTSGLTPLMSATANGNLNAVNALIEAGAMINSADKFGATALMAAAESGFTSIAKSLIQSDADVMLMDNDGSSAIDYEYACTDVDLELTAILENAVILASLNQPDVKKMVRS